MYSQDPDSQFFRPSSVPSVSHQYDTDYNIKHPDETDNHTKVRSYGNAKHVISWKKYQVPLETKIDQRRFWIYKFRINCLIELNLVLVKTTLLNVGLSRVVTGELLIDGQPLTNIDAFRRSAGSFNTSHSFRALNCERSLEISCVPKGDGDRDYLGVVSNLIRLPSENWLLIYLQLKENYFICWC
ncbi:BBT_HP_G0054520.mRNA.1.CDS.1 [Saccharomyces cerevisiae]|nr:BBT_HP_G0054520.mRNA.1.CDS.1 [Saccharomyces cerevisiae]CAI6703032.1 BBT_HP_G0054520.mRNA.1.CDS.1 [Saccharomyces cerevisiae]